MGYKKYGYFIFILLVVLPFAVCFPSFNSIDKFSIDISNNVADSANIYANSRHQVAVTVKLSLSDEKGDNVPLDEDTLRNVVYLCDYRTGNKLPTSGNAGSNFFYSKTEKEYNRKLLTLYSAFRSSGRPTTVVELYISAKSAEDSKLISAGISIPGVGDIDTTEDGTTTVLPNGSKFKNPKYVSINALLAIDYSKYSNLYVSNMPRPGAIDDMEAYVTNMLVTNNNWAADDYKNFAGTAYRTTITVASKSGYRFTTINVARNDLSPPFKPVSPPDTVWGKGGGSYIVFLTWFQRTGGLESGPTVIHSKCGWEDYYYVIGENDYRHYYSADFGDGKIKILIQVHKTPRSDAYGVGFSAGGDTVNVYVIDEYGNDGNIVFETNDKYIPGYKINGVSN